MNESENNTFKKIIADVELRDTTHELQSLEDIKNAILTSFFDHLSTFEGIDVNDEEVHAEACIILTNHVRYDFERREGLDYGDEVVSVDDVVVLIIDTMDETADTFILDSSAELRGEVRDLIVNNAPDIDAALDRTSEYDPDTNPGPIVPFGVGLILRDVTIRHPTEDPEFIPKHKIVFIPMGYSRFPLKKVA